jgi:DNA-directed RNA polymerase III subunit RPC4
MPDEKPPAPDPKPTLRGRGPPRPRGGIQRKSKAERDQFAKEETERQKTRAAELEAASRGGRGGTRLVSRGGRVEGTPAQRHGFGSGGVFGGGGVPVAQSKKKYEAYAELVEEGVKREGADSSPGKVAGGRSATGKSGDRGEGTSKGGPPGGGAPAVGETIEVITDDEPDDKLPKRDINEIAKSDNEDEDKDQNPLPSSDGKGKQKAASTHRTRKPNTGLRPVRAPRTERKEDGQDGQNDTALRKKRPSTNKRLDAESQEISSDNRDDDAIEDTDSVQLLKEQPSSPEQSRKKPVKPKAATTGKSGRDVKAAASDTVEDRAERLTIQHDEQRLRDIFGPKAELVHDDSDDDELPEPLDDGQLFLIQLPPLTPFLTDPTAAPEPLEEVKTETHLGANGTSIDLETKPLDSNPVDGPSKPAAQNPQLEGLLTATEPLRLPSGVVGKMKVHRSGKVTLDWGGTDMEVKLGSEVDFLQDVVLVTPAGPRDEMDVDGGDEEGLLAAPARKKARGTAYALGQVRQKMVLVPNWAKLYD